MKEGRLEPCLPMGAVLSRSGVSGSLRPRGPQRRQAPLSLGFSSLGYWSGLPCPPPGDPPRPEIEAASHMFPALTGGFFTPSGTWETQHPGDHVLKDSKLLFQFPPVSPVPDRTQSGNRPPHMQGQFPRWCYFSNHAKEHSASLTKMNPVQVIIRREF